MNSKTKIAISAIGIVMVLAIIGLTIGLVLVANQANVATNMTVAYQVTDVSCTIESSAKHYTSKDVLTGASENVGFTTAENGVIVDGVATDVFTILTPGTEQEGKTVASKSRAFNNVDLKAIDNGSGSAMLTTVVYTFKVTNTAAGGSLDAVITCAENTAENVEVTYAATNDGVAVESYANGQTVNVLAGKTLVVTITVAGQNATIDADFNGGVTVIAELHR